MRLVLVGCFATMRRHGSEAWMIQTSYCSTPRRSVHIVVPPGDSSSSVGIPTHRHQFTQKNSITTTTTFVPSQLFSAITADNEYEYVEYDILKEEDFVGSEWLVGTNWDDNNQQIVETWCRLAVDDKGQNVAIWGDDKQGKWSLDVASQFLAISKEGWLGKQIWACTTDDYYYLQGTVRGWNYLKAASVLGQWQAKRLGVDPEEAGTAPWFEEEESPSEENVASE